MANRILKRRGGVKSNHEGKECFVLMTHSTHFIYDYMASDIRYSTTLQEKKHIAVNLWATG